MRNFSCLGRAWQVLIVVSIFLSTFAFAQTAVDNSTNTSAEAQDSLPQEIIAPSENATNQPSTDTQPSTDAQPLTNNSDETPPISDISNSPINDTNEITASSETNITLPSSNETASNKTISNEAGYNETIIANDTANNSDRTGSEISNVTDTNSSISIPPVEAPTPLLNIDFVYPEKLTRGESLEIKANIANIGSADVNNVVLRWLLPEGFEKVSEQGSCGHIAKNSSCESAISVKSQIYSNLGLSEIRLVVNYG